jgi:hypothetical protein
MDWRGLLAGLATGAALLAVVTRAFGLGLRLAGESISCPLLWLEAALARPRGLMTEDGLLEEASEE